MGISCTCHVFYHCVYFCSDDLRHLLEFVELEPARFTASFRRVIELSVYISRQQFSDGACEFIVGQCRDDTRGITHWVRTGRTDRFGVAGVEGISHHPVCAVRDSARGVRSHMVAPV